MGRAGPSARPGERVRRCGPARAGPLRAPGRTLLPQHGVLSPHQVLSPHGVYCRRTGFRAGGCQVLGPAQGPGLRVWRAPGLRASPRRPARARPRSRRVPGAYPAAASVAGPAPGARNLPGLGCQTLSRSWRPADTRRVPGSSARHLPSLGARRIPGACSAHQPDPCPVLAPGGCPAHLPDTCPAPTRAPGQARRPAPALPGGQTLARSWRPADIRRMPG